jgi:hypothetical protein
VSEPGDVSRRQDELRRRDEHRHQTMQAIRRGDSAWALRHIAGLDAAIDHVQARHGGETTREPDVTDREPGKPRFPYRFVTTLDQLLANVASTAAAATLRVVGIDRDGDAVVEALTEWVAGPPAVAGLLGLDSPPAIDSFYVRAAVLGEITAAGATLRRAAELATEMERLAGG